MAERALTDVDGLLRRVQAAAQARPTVIASAGRDELEFDAHADAFGLAVRRCEQAFSTLGRTESRRSILSRLMRSLRAPGPTIPSPHDEALFALRDLVDRMAVRYRHDITYLLENVSEMDRKLLVADEVARRVELLEQSPDGAVIDLARFAAWFAYADLVLWLGDTDGLLHGVIAGAGPTMVYEATPETEGLADAAIISGRSVTADLVDQVTEIMALGGPLVVVLDSPADMTGVVDEVGKAGFGSARLAWLADELHGVAGSLVVTFRRLSPR
ncbi:MAG: hypothetical protein QOD72_1667 [Acidimicrobiaceae bacterium]|nr:hypothetical protein [Acidimicrobiaceae bacterium]